MVSKCVSLQWFSEYLGNRSQCVAFKGFLSVKKLAFVVYQRLHIGSIAFLFMLMTFLIPLMTFLISASLRRRPGLYRLSTYVNKIRTCSKVARQSQKEIYVYIPLYNP